MNPSISTSTLAELASVESAIAATTECLVHLARRQKQLWDALDVATRPCPAIEQNTLKTKTVFLAYCYQGEVTTFASEIDLYASLLRRLWDDFPEQRDTMAIRISRYGRSRCYVATSRKALFSSQSVEWANRHSRTLVDGWYLDENLNRERKLTVLRAAAQAVGLLCS